MKYPVAEKFVAPQGEGQFTGTPMAFIRLVGCSVGQKVCEHCDTDFDRMREDLGGGLFEPAQLVEWSKGADRVCLTGGEPLDRDLRPLVEAMADDGRKVHVETSGTKKPDWLNIFSSGFGRPAGQHAIGYERKPGTLSWRWEPVWLTVSPKPGWLPEMVDEADEVKVILGGLGDGPGWPTVKDALRWADAGKLVYVQPRNHRMTVDHDNLAEVTALVAAHPTLRVLTQLHKILRTR